MKITELEKRLYRHADTVKNNMTAPFGAEIRGLIEAAPYYEERTSTVMRSKRIVSVIAIAAVFACLATAFAANGLGGWFSGTEIVYEALPSEAQYMEDVGYAPILIESFENGYTYMTGQVMNNEVYDDAGDMTDTFKSAVFSYGKDGDEVIFSQDKAQSGISPQGSVVADAEGCKIYYHSYKNMVVPEDYALSAEEKAAEEKGDVIFSYGSDEVMEYTVQSVQWLDDGVQFMLMQMNGTLTADELVDMAKEAINSK